MSMCEMSRGVRGKEYVWSCKVQDDQELNQNVLGSHGVRVQRTDISVSRPTTSIMCSRGCENTMSRTGGESGLSEYVGGLSCVSCVDTKFHISTCVQRHHVWMTN